MKQIPGMSSTTKRTIEDEVDILLYDDVEGIDKFNPYSLTPIVEKLHFKNGQAPLPPAYKEPEKLKSILEAGMYVSEIPIMKMKGDTVKPSGIFAGDCNKVQVYIPGENKPYYLNKNKLRYILSRYVVGGYFDIEDGWEVRYVLLSMNKDTLLYYCERGQ